MFTNTITTRKHILAIVMGVMMFFGAFTFVPQANAQTFDRSAMLTQIQQLMQMVAQLQAQLTAIRNTITVTPISHTISIGDNVVATDRLKVRVSPGLDGWPKGFVPSNTQGRVIQGPIFSGGYTWWKVDYDNVFSEGWSAANWLRFVKDVEQKIVGGEIKVTQIKPSSGTHILGEKMTISWELDGVDDNDYRMCVTIKSSDGKIYSPATNDDPSCKKASDGKNTHTWTPVTTSGFDFDAGKYQVTVTVQGEDTGSGKERSTLVTGTGEWFTMADEESEYDIDIESPQTGAVYEPGDMLTLRWEEDDLDGEYGVIQLTGNNVQRTVAEKVEIGDEYYTFQIPVTDSLGAVTSGEYEIRLGVTDVKDGDPKDVSDSVTILIETDSNPNNQELQEQIDNLISTIEALGGGPERATLKGYINNSIFITTDNITYDDAYEDCEFKAANNPTSEVHCTWNGKLIYDDRTEGNLSLQAQINSLLQTISDLQSSTDETDENETITVKSSSQDPDASTLKLEEGVGSEYYSIFIFELDASDSESDLNIEEIVLDFDVSDGKVAEDIIDDIKLIVNGQQVTDVSFAGSGEIVAFVVGEIVEAGSTVEVEVYASFRPANEDISGVYFDVSVESVQVQGEGQDFLAASTAYSETHTLLLSDVLVDVLDTDAYVSQASSVGGHGEFEIELEVTAVGDDVYVYSSTVFGKDGVIPVHMVDGAKGISNVTGMVHSINSTADSDSGFFRIDEGETETITIGADFKPEYTATYSLQVDYLPYTVGAPGGVVKTTEIDDAQTQYILIEGTESVLGVSTSAWKMSLAKALTVLEVVLDTLKDTK